VANLRPKLREHATVDRHRYRGAIWYVVHDHATGRLHRLSSASFAIVEAMDGMRTVQQVWEEAGACLGAEAPSQDEVIELLAQLGAADLLLTGATADSAELLERAARARRSRWVQNIFNPLAMRVRLWQPDRFFQRTLPLVGWLVGWRGAALWLAVVLPAIVLAAQHWQQLTQNASERILAADNLLLIALSYPVLKALHEMGHGYAVKAFGGAVHEVGVMFLVFAPVPYVDASAASGFRSKWRRALVGAAGMMVEVFIAALALYVWLAVEHGFVRSLAYNVMLIAGITTVLFNGNPLLRYDGYYILSDILEMPNLAQRATRYWGYLVERYVFRAEDLKEPVATRGERAWLFLYAPASFCYRVAVMLAIAVFVASEYLAVGVAIAAWGLYTGVLLPIGKALGHVLRGPQLQRNRARAVATTVAFILVTGAMLFFVPAPAFTTTEGVIWLPESALVRAGTDGFVRRLLVEPGRAVTIGEALIESEEITLEAELAVLRARVAELEATLAGERFIDRAKAEITATELAHARTELASATERAHRLIARSRGDGTFAVLKPQDLPGRFMRQGQEIGYVLPARAHIVRATIGQDDIDLIRHRLSGVRVRLAARLGEMLPARIVREVPGGHEDLPSKALGMTGGGTLPIDPRDPQGKKTYNRVFQVDLELPAEAALMGAFGSRAYVRFDLHWEPIGLQMWRRTRQLLLSRLSA
jgi:putative peptide zinc metalloprotease protein